MEAFEAFLADKGRISDFHRPHYLRWVRLYQNFLQREGGKEPGAEVAESFIRLLENRCEPWKVDQARHAVQLYSYYKHRSARPVKGAIPVTRLSVPDRMEAHLNDHRQLDESSALLRQD